MISTGSAKRPSTFTNDLLARQRRAAALDHEAAAVDLVGAVDVDRHAVDLVGIEDSDAMGTQALGALLRARHGADDALALTGQCIDELVDGGAGADTDHAAGDDEIKRGAADQGLQFILRHREC
jgi:hypothetical protein